MSDVPRYCVRMGENCSGVCPECKATFAHTMEPMGGPYPGPDDIAFAAGAVPVDPPIELPKFPISKEAEDFIESAKILAEPYDADIERLRAGIARLGAVGDEKDAEIADLKRQLRRANHRGAFGE